MKWGWLLITVYMGPIALPLYVLTNKELRPGEHEAFIRPLWKQGIGSTVHCIAGDATGIVAAAVITAALGLPMWVDLSALTEIIPVIPGVSGLRRARPPRCSSSRRGRRVVAGGRPRRPSSPCR